MRKRDMYIFKCNNCKMWGVGSTAKLKEYRFKCRRCGKQKRHIIDGQVQMDFRGPIDPDRSFEIIANLNMCQGKEKEPGFKIGSGLL